MNSQTGSKIDPEDRLIEQPTESIIDDRYHQKSWFGKLLQAIDPSIRADREPMFWKKRVRAASSKKNRNGNVYDDVRSRSVPYGKSSVTRTE